MNENPINNGYPIEDFLKAQFAALREEIKESKNRRYQIVASGIIVVPLISVLAERIEAQWICLILPIFIIAVVVLEISENNAIYRAGEYIQKHIEKNVLKEEDKKWEQWLAWEQWLDTDNRETDLYVNRAFTIIFSIYYICSVLVGYIWLYKKILELKLSCFGDPYHCTIIAFFVCLFLYGVVFVLIANFYLKRCKWCNNQRNSMISK